VKAETFIVAGVVVTTIASAAILAWGILSLREPRK
jgi:hypothetical protein